MAGIQAEVGARMRRIDQVTDRHGDEALGLAQRIGELEDVDVAEVIVALQSADNASAALSATAAQVLGRSLFDYLG